MLSVCRSLQVVTLPPLSPDWLSVYLFWEASSFESDPSLTLQLCDSLQPPQRCLEPAGSIELLQGFLEPLYRYIYLTQGLTKCHQ